MGVFFNPAPQGTLACKSLMFFLLSTDSLVDRLLLNWNHFNWASESTEKSKTCITVCLEDHGWEILNYRAVLFCALMVELT